MKIATYVTNVIMTRCALAVVPKNTCTHARTMADSTRHALRGELLGAAAAQFEAARAFVAAGFACTDFMLRVVCFTGFMPVAFVFTNF